jgi:hypothetical protein
LRIHEFVKDSYTGENLVRITKPYYSCSATNILSFNNASTANVALIYARFPEIPSWAVQLNGTKIKTIEYEINKPYLLILEKSGSSVNFSYYV